MSTHDVFQDPPEVERALDAAAVLRDIAVTRYRNGLVARLQRIPRVAYDPRVLDLTADDQGEYVRLDDVLAALEAQQ